MTSVIGLPLARAKALLSSEGIIVTVEEARSKKGVPGGTEARVIRQTSTDHSHALLVYSVFRTEPVDPNQ